MIEELRSSRTIIGTKNQLLWQRHQLKTDTYQFNSVFNSIVGKYTDTSTDLQVHFYFGFLHVLQGEIRQKR